MAVSDAIEKLEEARKALEQDDTWRSDLIDEAHKAVSDEWFGASTTMNDLLKRFRPDLAAESSDPANERGQKLSNVGGLLNALRIRNASKADRLAAIDRAVGGLRMLK